MIYDGPMRQYGQPHTQPHEICGFAIYVIIQPNIYNARPNNIWPCIVDIIMSYYVLLLCLIMSYYVLLLLLLLVLSQRKLVFFLPST